MYRKFVKISLILVYLVIIAGAMVRMTGSGMGCPDWPKCFGYYIPPTEASTLEWSPNREFEKGQVIIVDEALRVALSDFITKNSYDENNWEAYTKHDYATFNVWHTWIEYVNRLLGALSGLGILIMAILSIWKWRERKLITVLSWLSVVFIAFQGYLGATVVYSVLAPVKITIHMVMALVIVALLLYLIHISKKEKRNYNVTRGYRTVLLFAFILSFIQIIVGTQVRQFIDEQVTTLGYDAQSQWLDSPTLSFYIHRTFSLLVIMLHIILWYYNKAYTYGLLLINILAVVVFAEVLTGISMYYFSFPFLTQPLHLVFASVLFGLQFYLLLTTFQGRDEWKSS